jgi:hypothetical protein
VLQAETWRLSGGVHHWLKSRSTREERKPVSRNDNNNNNNNNNNNPIHYLSHAFKNSFPNINLKFTTKKTENIIKSLKPKNSHGYNKISTNLLKTSSVYISSPLNHICNKSSSYRSIKENTNT